MSFEPQALGSLGITEEQIQLMDVAENFCRDASDIASVRAQMKGAAGFDLKLWNKICLLYTSPSPRDQRGSRMPSSA